MNDKKHEQRFGQAVQLAAAFVANGDIRLNGSTREDSQAMAMVGDLIGSLYNKLADVDAATAAGT